MDPLSQAALGAAAARAALARRSPLSFRAQAVLGALGGMAPDLDVLIRSERDPLLAIEYHRHFTHSLAFIPFGGVLVGLPFLLLPKLRAHWRWVLLATTVGLGTHGLLDACTTYGTLLLWPFSSHRVSWHVVSVIDPLFTLPLLFSLIWCVWRKRTGVVWLGLSFALAYLGLGVVQRERARSVQLSAAERRGHSIERGVVLPSFSNNVTWRSLYVSSGRAYVDKIRVTWLGRECLTSGQSVPLVAAPDTSKLRPAVARGERLIRWFASDWVAHDPRDVTVLGDLRYSFAPGQIEPIWGIRRLPVLAAPEQQTAVEWVNNNSRRRVSWAEFRRLIFEDGPDALCF